MIFSYLSKRRVKQQSKYRLRGTEKEVLKTFLLSGFMDFFAQTRNSCPSSAPPTFTFCAATKDMSYIY